MEERDMANGDTPTGTSNIPYVKAAETYAEKAAAAPLNFTVRDAAAQMFMQQGGMSQGKADLAADIRIAAHRSGAAAQETTLERD